jgi:hypothetical protein
MLRQLRKVFASFQSHDVKYVVIGGIAAVLHGVPRATFACDVLIEATPENAKRILEALASAGLGTATLTSQEELLATEVTVFKDYVRIDVQTKTPGLDFKRAWAGREQRDDDGQPFFIVSRSDLIASKKASARPIDLEDIRLLESNRGSQD